MNWGNCVDKAGGALGAGVAKLSCIPILIKNLITWGLMLGVITAVFFIIFAGVKMITSQGDAKNVEDARKTLVYALVGLIVIFLSFFIVNVISVMTGADCIKVLGFDACAVTGGGGGRVARP